MDQLCIAPRPIDLSTLTFPFGIRVAVTAPHPDDFDVIAITMRLLMNSGADIHVAVLTSGVSGVDDGYKGATTAEQKARIREDEQRASFGAVGLAQRRLTFLRLNADAAGFDEVHHFIGMARPELLFMPHADDSNTTHRWTHQAVTQAIADERLDTVALFNQDPKTRSFRRDAFTAFDEKDAEWKASLLRLHASQQERNLKARGSGLDARILEMNRTGPSAYAEAFEIACYREGRL